MLARPRITIVDDNPPFLELMSDILEDQRYPTTLIVGDSPGALAEIVASEPELLIIDLHLGPDGLHGWDVVHRVREVPELRDVPVLICTADLDALATAAEELSAPRIGAIQKPFSVLDLLAAIDGLLEH